jgi:hypothetical protein
MIQRTSKSDYDKDEIIKAVGARLAYTDAEYNYAQSVISGYQGNAYLGNFVELLEEYYLLLDFASAFHLGIFDLERDIQPHVPQELYQAITERFKERKKTTKPQDILDSGHRNLEQIKDPEDDYPFYRVENQADGQNYMFFEDVVVPEMPKEELEEILGNIALLSKVLYQMYRVPIEDEDEEDTPEEQERYQQDIENTFLFVQSVLDEIREMKPGSVFVPNPAIHDTQRNKIDEETLSTFTLQ